MATSPFTCTIRAQARPGHSEIASSPVAHAIQRIVSEVHGPLLILANIVGGVLTVIFFPYDLALRVAHLVAVPLVLGVQVLYPLGRPIGSAIDADGVVIASALILLLIRLLLLPFAVRSTLHAVRLQAIQPHIRALQAQLANDKDAMQEALARLYKESKVNPFGCVGFLLPAILLIVAFYGCVALLVTRSSVGTFSPRHVSTSSALAAHMHGLRYFVSWHMDLTRSIVQVGRCQKLLPYAGLLVGLLAVTAWSISRYSADTRSRALIVTGVTGVTLVGVAPLPAFVVVLRTIDAIYLAAQGKYLARRRNDYELALLNDPEFHAVLADSYSDIATALRRH